MTLPFTGFVVPSGGSSSGGSGDVTGPGSSTDNAIARFDGTGGKTLQDSGILVTDAAQLSWEGATADDFETTLGVTDPTADRTILLPNESGTLVVGSTGATDNAILRADGGGGATLQNSPVTIADTTGTVDNSGGNGKYISGGSNTTAYFCMGGTGAGNWGWGLDSNGVPSPVRGDAGAIGSFRALSLAASGGTLAFNASVAGFPAFVTSGNNVYYKSAGSSPAPILSAVLVEASTSGSGAPNVITALESRTVFTNEGTTAANYHTLPTAVAGYVFEFIVQDADGIRIVANTSDTIRVIDKVTAAAGYIESTTIGSTVRLVSINAVEWFATSIHGVWTDGTFTFDDTGSTSP